MGSPERFDVHPVADRAVQVVEQERQPHARCQGEQHAQRQVKLVARRPADRADHRRVDQANVGLVAR